MPIDIRDIPTSWLMVPAPWPVDQPPAANEQRWQMTLTGIADINFTCYSPVDWHHETYKLYLGWQSPTSWAYGREPPEMFELAFQAEQWAPQVTVNSVYAEGPAPQMGYAVDSFKPVLYTATNMQVQTASNYFDGLEVVVGAKGMGIHIYKLSFQVTMFGRVVPVNWIER